MDKRKILGGEKELGFSTNPWEEAYKDKMVRNITIVKKLAKHYSIHRRLPLNLYTVLIIGP